MTTELTADVRTDGRATEPDVPGPKRTVVDRLRRAPEWLVCLGVGGLVAVLGAIAQWRGTFFYYVGDQHEQFMPLWHLFGDQLRAGRLPMMDPAGWLGGQNAAEAVTGIWNPVNLANYLLVSTFDDLNHAAFVVVLEFLVLLGMGTFLLAREYGSSRWPAVLLASALPVSGFTLWYEASGWLSGLMAFTWVAHFWWSARRFSRGRLNPLVPFVFGALAVTTGNPYAVLGLIVVLGAIAVELLAARRYAVLTHLVVLGACVGALALLVFLPLLGITGVSNRQTLAKLANDTFFVPGVGDIVASSSPTYLPAITNWGGVPLESLPSTYFAWFVVPLLPWLRWRLGLARVRRAGISLFLVAGFYLLASLGPSNVWLFRWPERLIEYFYLGLAVLFALVMTAGLGRDRIRLRAWLSAAVVLIDCYLAWAVRPIGLDKEHATGLVLVAALVAGAVWLYSRRGMPGLGAVVLVGTAAIVALQTSVFPAQAPGSTPVYPGYDLARLRATTADYQGTVLQLATVAVTTEQRQSGAFMFGNLPRALGRETVTSYTGQGFQKFMVGLCIDYRGAVCPQALDRLWLPTSPTAEAPLVDAMRVSTLVIQRSLVPDVVARRPPPGWHVADVQSDRVVWTRDRPVEGSGRVSWSSPGVQVRSDASQPAREVVRFRADADGRLLFARLAWPGYTASVDGRPVRVVDDSVGLLEVPVAAGEHTLVLSYTTPGLRLGALAAVAAVAVALAQAVLWTWQRRRRRRRTAGT